MIEKSDYEAFEGTLAEHQMRLTKEGWTLLAKAVIEHNLIAASKVYNNIALADLAKILNVNAEGVCFRLNLRAVMCSFLGREHCCQHDCAGSSDRKD